MIVWGGASGSSRTNTGGQYCACLAQTVYRDADGDGYGDRTTPTSSCDGSIPGGFVSNDTDCNDANAFTYPNAPEINDGIDNQCVGNTGFGVADEISGVSGFFTPDDPTRFSWPPQSGAISYHVLRSTTRDFSSDCSWLSTDGPAVIDVEIPIPETVFFYLVRPSAPLVGSWGQRHDGSPRVGGCLDM
jgi:hypothetical protein